MRSAITMWTVLALMVGLVSFGGNVAVTREDTSAACELQVADSNDQECPPACSPGRTPNLCFCPS